MSVDDQCSSAADRQRRWLYRALIVVGGTVAGISAACLLGTAHASSLAESDTADRTPSRAQRQASPQQEGRADSGPLAGLVRSLTGATERHDGAEAAGTTSEEDARHSDATGSPSADGRQSATSSAESSGKGDSGVSTVLDPVTDSVTSGVETVRRGAEPVLDPVRRAADTVVSGTSGQDSLTGAVGGELERVRDTLVTTDSHEVQRSSQNTVTHPAPSRPRRTPDVHTEPTTERTPEADRDSTRSRTLTSRSPSVATAGAEHLLPEPAVRKEPANRQRSLDLPPFSGGGCACGTDTTNPSGGSASGIGLTGWVPATPAVTAKPLSATGSGTTPPVDTEGPQPGTTPD
ncbi:hypothetical protein [Actinopolyspora mortivallis]|uniref:Uncharacterized protein n=1 Tax=Actinopolyspora mortivallis TaxID=33906 RepID=A0A2T0GWF7_ACTMO|nr:hypothetical protein [Actinopolyspora mortivallis]PRW63446.1 hypothetical protein CEP50_10205 [Actinopolyspora mortivallis]